MTVMLTSIASLMHGIPLFSRYKDEKELKPVNTHEPDTWIYLSEFMRERVIIMNPEKIREKK